MKNKKKIKVKKGELDKEVGGVGDINEGKSEEREEN